MVVMPFHWVVLATLLLVSLCTSSSIVKRDAAGGSLPLDVSFIDTLTQQYDQLSNPVQVMAGDSCQFNIIHNISSCSAYLVEDLVCATLGDIKPALKGVVDLDAISDLNDQFYVARLEVDSCADDIKLTFVANDISEVMTMIPNRLKFSYVMLEVELAGVSDTSTMTGEAWMTGLWDLTVYPFSAVFDVMVTMSGDVFKIKGSTTAEAGGANIDGLIELPIFPMNTDIPGDFVGVNAQFSTADTEIEFFTEAYINEKSFNVSFDVLWTNFAESKFIKSYGVVGTIDVIAFLSNFLGTDLKNVIGFDRFPEVDGVIMVLASEIAYSKLTPYYDEIANFPRKLTKNFNSYFTAPMFGETMTFIIQEHPSGGYWVVPMSSTPITVKNMLSSTYDTDNLDTPLGIDVRPYLEIPITGVYCQTKQKVYGLTIAPSDFKIYEGVIELTDMSVLIANQFNMGAQLVFEMSGKWNLGSYGLNFKVGVEGFGGNTTEGFTGSKNVYTASAWPDDPLRISDMVNKIGVSFIPSNGAKSLVQALGFLNMEIQTPKLSVQYGEASGYKVMASGTITMGNWANIYCEILVGLLQSEKIIALGLQMNEFSLDDIVDKLTDGKINIRNIPGISIFVDSQIGLAISNNNLARGGNKYFRFGIELLKDAGIEKGLIMGGLWTVPDDCGNPANAPVHLIADVYLCKLMQEILGVGGQLAMYGKVTKTEFLLSATINTAIVLSDDAKLTKVTFSVKAGKDFELALHARLYLSDLDLTFDGKIGLTKEGLALSMNTLGIWEDAFGLSFLALEDIYIATAFIPPTNIRSLEMGATAYIGTTNKPIKASVYLGCSPGKPKDNYIMGSFSKLTMSSMVNAFIKKNNLPKAFKDIGFPDGANFSAALDGRVLPNGIVIPEGLFFTGTLKILSFELFADIELSPNGIYAEMRAKPFKLFGSNLVKVSGIKKNSDALFLLTVNWFKPGQSKLVIEGSVTVLGITKSVSIYIDSKEARFTMTEKILNFFESEFTVRTSYPPNAIEFQVKGFFKQSLLEKVRKEVSNQIKKEKEKAEKDVKKAKKDIESAQKKFDSAEKELGKAKSTIKSAENSVKNLEKKVKDKNCSKQCSKRKKRSIADIFYGKETAETVLKRVKRGWFKEKGKEIKEKGYEVAEKVEEGKERVRYAACKVKCEIEKKALQLSLKIAETALKVARATLNEAQKAVNTLKKSLNAAKAILNAAMDLYGGFLFLADSISKLGLGGLVDIKKVSYDVKLSAMNGGVFKGAILARFLDNKKYEETLNVTIDTKDIGKMVATVFKRFGQLIKKELT